MFGQVPVFMSQWVHVYVCAFVYDSVLFMNAATRALTLYSVSLIFQNTSKSPFVLLL